MSARPAKGGFPYPHRTVAEVWEADASSIEALDWISRRRALTDRESRKLEQLLRRAA